MFTDLTLLCVTGGATIRDAATQMEKSGIRIVLFVDQEQRLLGTITDGDIRRAVLSSIDLARPISVLLDQKQGSIYSHPITAPVGSDPDRLMSILQQHKIFQIPLVDADNKVVALATMEDLIPQQEQPPQAVIMAGGAGVRLRPLTDDTPKPMLPVGDRPLLEIIVEQLRNAGINQVNIAVHHKSEQIIGHFGDGQKFGVDISYVTEDRPLGTAGAIGLMSSPPQTLLIIYGDIFTQVDFRAMLSYHREHAADLTVAVLQYDMQVPYGVVECQGSAVESLTEKPQFKFLVNAGIYLLEPHVHSSIPNGKPSDMTDIIQDLLQKGRPVVAFPIYEGWIDIGQIDDYRQAQADANNQPSES
jgi:dTDP-glucose pyrophosphorylase/CBS domain-containing protein